MLYFNFGPVYVQYATGQAPTSAQTFVRRTYVT